MIHFIFSLLISIGIFLLLLFLRVLFFHHKKNVPFKSIIALDNLVRSGAFLLTYLLFLLIIYLSFKRITVLSIIWLSIFTSIFFCLIPFASLIAKIKNKELKKLDVLKTIGFVGAFLVLILEVSLLSRVGDTQGKKETEIAFNSNYIIDISGDIKGDYVEFDEQKQFITFDNSSLKMESIYLDLSSDIETKLQVDVYVSQNLTSFNWRKSYPFNPNYNAFEYFDLSEYQDSPYIKIVFVKDETNVHKAAELKPIYLHKIVVNRAFPYTFNPVRVLLFTGSIAGILWIIKKATSLNFKEMSVLDKVQKVVLIVAGMGFLYILINSLVCSYSHFEPIANVTGESPNIYYQLFDAFKKGQVYLDVKPSDGLLATKNPYAGENRTGYTYLWDHAYYKGKYYCYYGAAPVILVMFPIYLLSGFKYVPTTLLMTEIGVLFSILAFTLALIEVIRVLFKRTNLPVLTFAIITAILSSLLLTNNIYKVGTFTEGIYRIPYAYGLLFLFLTLFFSLKAYQKQEHRIVYLALTGLSVVLLMASRPTLIFGLILIVPLFIKILIEKYPLKQKVIDLLPMVGIVVLGAIGIMIYNYVRFDSVFEFGQSYQLTVTDNTKLAYSVKGIIPTLRNFYILPPSANSNGLFPLFSYGYIPDNHPYHPYNSGGVGLLFFPVTWFVAVSPFLFKKGDDLFLRIMIYLSPLVVFLIAFTTYCFAGVCPRYVVELTSIASFFGIVCLLKLSDLAYEKNQIVTLFGFSLIFIFSSIFSFNLLFYGFDGWGEGDQHGLLEVVRSIFNQYNI